jgi:3-hydroxybutyryl-CoA dehydrogenase
MFNKIGIVGGGVMATGVRRLLLRENMNAELIDSRKFLENSIVGISNFDLIIECAVEDLSVKKMIFEKLVKLNEHAVLASCTSSLSIDVLQENIAGCTRFLGIHFMNPATSIKTVEVVPSFQTNPKILAEVVAWLEGIEKLVSVVPDSPGFVVNALLFSFLNQAMILMETTNLSAKEIDELVTGSLGHSLGPFKTMDLIGIDTCENILSNLHQRNPELFLEPSMVIKELTSRGITGRKGKQGFYSY